MVKALSHTGRENFAKETARGKDKYTPRQIRYVLAIAQPIFWKVNVIRAIAANS